MFALACAAGVAAAPLPFDIPRQDAAQALTQFARQAGIPILFPYDLASGRRANALRGRHEPAEGLRRLLKGTGLVASSDAGGQISVRLAPEPGRRPLNGLVATLREVEQIEEGAEGALREITDTGSRIDRDGMVTPTPVTAIFGAELQAMGPGTLVDALVQLPQFLNNDTPQTQSFSSSGAAGSSFMNLRGIGSSRTLTLLDGRRVVPTTRTGAVDIALLPKNLVERIDVVTGGASAAYGSDAVSGVVNVVLGRRNDGLKLRVQGGISELGDNANYEWSASWGGEIGERTHLLASAELFRADGVRGYGRREWFGSWASIANPDPAGPREIIARDVRATGYTYGGLITSGPLAGTQFLEGGVPAPFHAGRFASTLTQVGGSGVDPGRDLVWIQPDQTRGNLFARLERVLGEDMILWGQGLFGFSENGFEKDPPSEWGTWEATIYADNAFLPASIRARMTQLGLPSFRLGRVSALDLGTSRVTNLSRLTSLSTGFETPLPGGWNLDGYYQFGANHAVLDYLNAVRLDRVYRAFDTVVDPGSGRIVCRSTLSFPGDGCVPANPFGPGSIAAEAADWITEGRSEQDQQVRQHVAELRLQGEPVALPAGPVRVALGGAWRRETVDNSPRRFPQELEGLVVLPAAEQGYRGLPATFANQSNIFERTAASRVAGGYAVTEAFAEAALPLLRDRAFARRVELDLAVRPAHYSGSGGVMAWKAGLDWQLRDSLRLRATRSRDIRAGSLSERFDFSGTGGTVADPFLPGRPTYQITTIRGGNPEVEPEKADTLTFGAVLQPHWLPGLSIAADYFDIRIRDAIGTLGVQTIMDRCFAGEGALCALIDRNGGGQVASINNLFLNIAEARSRGIDAELAWRRRVNLLGGDEAIALRLFANRTFELSTTGFETPKIDRAGQTGLTGGAPRWQANLALVYERGPLQLTVQERLISPGRYNAAWGPADISDNRVAGAAYTNLRLAWRLGEEPRTTLLFLNVTNLFDRDPPLAPDWTFVGSFHTNEGLFDVLGRRYTAGVRVRL